MQIERQRRSTRGIDLTPLIDIVFLLIIFFMLSTSFVVSESMELSIPSNRDGVVTGDDIWVLNVRNDGNVAIRAQNPIDLSEMDRQVRKQLANNPEQKILVLSQQGVTVQQLVHVLDIININGGHNVQIDHASQSDIGSDVKMVQ